jgi:8-oxo-dGTP pyrophosphatase MutT (NUDIX family)
MRWKVHGERPLYQNRWVDLWLADVELPDGNRIDHHVIKMMAVAAAVVLDGDRVLMIWRHRFITDTWGWELPAGLIDPGEEPIIAAAREVEEETGYRPNALRPLIEAQPSAGICNAAHHIFRADGATLMGPPTEQNEAERIDWIPLADIRHLIDTGDLTSSLAMVGLLYVLSDRR